MFELVSPERLLTSREVGMVVIPGAEGDFGVLAGHAPMISTLRPGVIEIHADGAVDARVFVASGFSEVSEDRCTVLAEEAIEPGDIDRAAAEERRRAAQEALAGAGHDSERRDAEHELAVAEAMLAATEQT